MDIRRARGKSMVKRCVRVYIEGGAEGRVADSDFRRCWKKFLMELHELARNNNFHSLEVVRGKGRHGAYESFKKRRNAYPNDLCVLLVDSETVVPPKSLVWDVVKKRKGDNWERPAWATEDHLYLMAVFVETWLLTDQDALKTFFKRNFNEKVLPTTNLEKREKPEIEQALRSATRHCSKSYSHGLGNEIIEIVKAENVKTLSHGNRLFTGLSNLIQNQN